MSLSASSTKWDARFTGPVPHNNAYYGKCFVGGILACGLTHTAITPLDVTKCNMQVNPTQYKGLFSGLRLIVAQEGSKALWKGWGPTLAGYSAQGAFKFGLYEFFKDFYGNLVGQENSIKYKELIWCAGSASAEFFADIVLCPMEMTKVKVQTSVSGTFPTAFGAALKQMANNRVETRFPFGSLGPLWSRQIPYNVSKFFFFEKIAQGFYTYVFTAPKDSYSKTTQLGVTFASGYSAGVICAIVSHPADTIVSLMSKPSNKGKTITEIAKETGFKTLVSKGLGTRVLMIGTLTGLQWWIYDSFKSAFGMGTTGGAVEKK
ncbi:Cu/Pi carrier [Basidiobolus ranarum]|uniref:Cu/Pi carrier n=1 Tax=Basidiobolus ranarum TaxID=34480 RepID=A0ABR2VR97_9FUNG